MNWVIMGLQKQDTVSGYQMQKILALLVCASLAGCAEFPGVYLIDIEQGNVITDEMVAAFQIAGSPDQCREDLADLIGAHDFDVFVINVISPGIDTNRQLLEDIVSFTQELR